MEYVARTIEIALVENMNRDAMDFGLSPALWAQAVDESNYVAALEDLRIVFIDDVSAGL